MTSTPDSQFGPMDDDLIRAQTQVERAERDLAMAREARARVMADAHRRGYSIHTLGRLTGDRRAPSVQRDLRRRDKPAEIH